MRSIRWFGCARSSHRAAPPRLVLRLRRPCCRSMNYNHALCVWRPAALALIYSLAVRHLVEQRHYPASTLDLKCAVAAAQGPAA